MNEKIIKNRYEIIRGLAKGGFGKTYLAKDMDWHNRLCVVKQLDIPKHHAEFAYIQDKFRQEAKVLDDLGEAIDHIPALRHRIPKLYAYFTEDDSFYLVQQWIPGKTLAEQVREKLLSEAQVRQFLVDILPVLQLIHDHGIVHRDVKPGNLIMRESDEKPVLIDFGIVKELAKIAANPDTYFRKPSLRTGTSTIIGTPGFMSPEQETSGAIYPSTDLYSLGMTAIYAMTGEVPRSSQTGKLKWRRFAPGVSRAFGAILDRALQTDPLDRYSTAQEMLEAIQSLPPIIDPDLIPTTAPDSASHSARNTSSYLSRTLNSSIQVLRQRLPLSRSIMLSLVGTVVAIGTGYFYFNHQTALSKYEAAKRNGDYQTCLTKAKQLTQFHLLGHTNTTDTVKQLETECAEAAATKLQIYLRVTIPKLLREKYGPKFATASLIEEIEPTVQVMAEQISVICSSSPKSNLTAENLKWLTVLFMGTFRGTPDGLFSAQYDSFSQLVVNVQGKNLQATITTEQWNAYLEKYVKAPGHEKDDVKEQFVNQIHISNQ